MKSLIKKEFSLCLHPASVLFLFFGVLTVIPNYPYEVMFFFSGLGVFFICLTARENGDFPFTCTLPVEKKKIALARMLLCLILQGAQLLFACVCVLIKDNLFPMPNYAGMESNLALFGLGFFMFGIFNLTYFPIYFSNPNKVGKPFLLASILLFFIVCLDVVGCYACPFWAKLDTQGLAFFTEKLLFTITGLVAYLGCTAGAITISCRKFSSFDV